MSCGSTQFNRQDSIVNVKLALGMKKEDVRELIGLPNKVSDIKKDGIKLQVWVYKYKPEYNKFTFVFPGNYTDYGSFYTVDVEIYDYIKKSDGRAMIVYFNDDDLLVDMERVKGG